MAKRSTYVSALSPEYALLGLLVQGPTHGYDLHRRLLLDLGQVWHISQSQLYNILKRLEAQGDITGEVQAHAGMPDRRIFQLTEQGRQRFESWLATPTGCSVRALRVEFITRLYFATARGQDQALRMIEDQTVVLRQGLERLHSANNNFSANEMHPPEKIFNHLGLEFRIQQLRAALDWMEGCAETIRRLDS
jgi:DNA-binding PadR family transcriptional regulator